VTGGLDCICSAYIAVASTVRRGLVWEGIARSLGPQHAQGKGS
jgi:hypothetical protein